MGREKRKVFHFVSTQCYIKRTTVELFVSNLSCFPFFSLLCFFLRNFFSCSCCCLRWCCSCFPFLQATRVNNNNSIEFMLILLFSLVLVPYLYLLLVVVVFFSLFFFLLFCFNQGKDLNWFCVHIQWPKKFNQSNIAGKYKRIQKEINYTNNEIEQNESRTQWNIRAPTTAMNKKIFHLLHF